MKAYYYKDGLYIQRSQSTQMGQGGFGTLFEGEWHGQPAVFKFIKMGKSVGVMILARDIGADLENRLTEINKVPDSSNILKPLGHFRQQERSLDESTGKYIADNSEVFVLKKCRMDLEKFKIDEYPQLNDPYCKLLLSIVQQCFER